MPSARFGQHPPRRPPSAAVPPPTARSSVDDTPLDCQAGAALLRGLEVHTVPAADDGHPLAVYTVREEEEEDDDEDAARERRRRVPVLLLHGQTWSSVAVYHLAGGGGDMGEDRSLLRALHRTQNIQPYAMDFRGFGGTTKDASGLAEPLRCVADVVSVLDWLHERHGAAASTPIRPALLGWSHGALVAQIAAQRHADALSKLIL